MLFLKTRAEFDSMLLERINATFTSEVDLALASQAQFYFDALWAGALGVTETLGQYLILLSMCMLILCTLFNTPQLFTMHQTSLMILRWTLQEISLKLSMRILEASTSEECR